MAKNSGNMSSDVTEAVNAQNPKKADESMTTRAVRQFIEHKFLGADGGNNFNEITFNKGNGLSDDFLKFVASKPEFDEQSDIQKEAFKNVANKQFLRETWSIGAGFESKRYALKHIISLKYEFTDGVQGEIEGKINNLSLNALDGCVRSEFKRRELLKTIMDKQEIITHKRESVHELDTVFVGKNLTDEQREAALSLMVKNNMHPDDVRSIIHLFKSPEERQLLIKLFIPYISLGELENIGVISYNQAIDAIVDNIKRWSLKKRFPDIKDTDIREIARTIGTKDIMIETYLFPETIVDAILKSDKGIEYIANELSAQNTERSDDLEKKENGMLLKANTEKKFLPTFQKEVKKLGVLGWENFIEGSYITGKTKDRDGEEVTFVYRIDTIEDDATKNSKIYDGEKVIALTQIIQADGTWKKHTSISKVPDIWYGKMRDFLGQALEYDKTLSPDKKSFQILTEDEVKRKTTTQEIKTTVPESIDTIDDLNQALDSIDPQGSKYQLKEEWKEWEVAGSLCISVWEPGAKDYWVYRIVSVSLRNNTIGLHNGSSVQYINFSDFLETFKCLKSCKRIADISNIQTVFSSVSTSGTKSAGAFEKLSFEDGKILMQDRKDEKDFPWINEFVGKNGCIHMEKMDDPKTVTFSYYPDFKELSDGRRDYGKGMKYTVGYHTLSKFLIDGDMSPVSPEKSGDGPKKVDVHPHMHAGLFKRYLSNYSIHDMIKGTTDVLTFLKEHLHHGSSLNASKFQLALGKKMKWLGVDDGLIREMRAKVHSNNKKLMTEMVDALKGMPWKERQEEIDHILTNHWSHDYEIHAAAIAMLQKHGTLYVGSLKKYQWTFMFFERMIGWKYSESLEIVQRCKKSCLETGEPFSEELLIQFYLRDVGWPPQYAVDGNLWLEIKKWWWQGIDDEAKTGDTETFKYQTLGGRTGYVMGKLKEGEFAHGLWGLKAILDKGAEKWSYEMHLPGVVLALSDIPKYLHQSQLKTIRNMFLGGRPYTAFAFLKSPAEQQTFRNVIEKLSASDPVMKKDYAVIKALQKSDPKKELPEAIIKFWGIHGAVLDAKLNITQDAEILQKKDSDVDLQTYFDTCSEIYGGYKTLDKEDFSNGAFSNEHSSFFAFNPDNYLRQFVRVNPAQSILAKENDETRFFWDNALKSINSIREMRLPGTPDEVEKTKFLLYSKYHRAIMGYFNDGRFAKPAYENLAQQDYIQQLEHRQGMHITPYGSDFLSSKIYDQHIANDFKQFMEGEQTVKNEKVKVLNNMNEVLAANDDIMERAA